MMDRVIPMLPKELSNGICSLNAHDDRLSLSVMMEIDDSGKVISSDIKKTVINVRERMSYTNVYKILRQINGEPYMSIHRRLNIVKISVLLKLIYKLIRIPVKIPASLFVDRDKLLLKLTRGDATNKNKLHSFEKEE